jgi:alkaline phosphatase
MKHNPLIPILNASLLVLAGLQSSEAASAITRLTPPSALAEFGDSTPPYISRFLPGQRFDLQCTVAPDSGKTVTAVSFTVNGKPVKGTVSLTPATVTGLPAGSAVATLRAYSNTSARVHTFTATATLSDGSTAVKTGNFEIVKTPTTGAVKNVIFMIGDGMGATHRTAARIMSRGVEMGKAVAPLAMDTFPSTGMAMTASLNSIITDSAPGAACYSTGNKSNNNQQGVFPDDTVDKFDNPRVEFIGEYLARTQGAALGIVTTSDVFDATPAAFAVHTQDRGAGTGICDQFLDESALKANLRVLLGGGRKWFLPSTTAGSARAEASDYVLPAELSSGWGVAAGTIDKNRDLLADFQTQGFTYAPDRASLQAVPATATKLLGLFALSNMNVAKDKIDGRRSASTVVGDYGFPDQPMLDEMTDKALQVLSKNKKGFCLMVEAASIDKQAHAMDSERWVLDTIEFDRAVAKAKAFAEKNRNTLVIITADHECAGVAIIGASTVTNAALTARAASGGGAAQLRTGVVGVYESAGFPLYTQAADGYPTTTDVDYKMLIGYAGNADRYEDWLTNAKPLRDSQQPFNSTAPLNTYPSGPLNRDVAGGFMVTGQVPGSSAVHSGSDIPVSAYGPGHILFTGVYDNTEVFFKVMRLMGLR